MHDKSQYTAGTAADFSCVLAEIGRVARLRNQPEKTSTLTADTGRLRISVPRQTAAKLKHICGGSTFSAWTALVAGAALYLSRYARTEFIPIAAPARRDVIDSDPGGIFPALLQLDPAATFGEVLESFQRQISRWYANQSFSPQALADAGINVPGSRRPFQIGMSYAGLHWPLPESAADIRINFEPDESGGIWADVAFDKTLFTAQNVNDILAGQLEFLSQGLQQPERRCSELSLVPPDSHIVKSNCGPEACTPPVEDFVDLFEQIAFRQPMAIAVREGEKDLTYRELNRRAEELARFLIARDCRSEEIIGVAMNRSAESIVAILGIWKAGAAYLPCDLNLPLKRLSQMLRDSGARLVLTDRDLTLPGDCSVSTVQASKLSGPAKTTLTETRRRSPEQLAYVIYTSGSTGQPKGVMLSHRGLANLARAQRVVFSNEECRHVLQFSAHSFDASIFDITMALAHGGVLHMAGDLEIPAGEQLFDVLQSQRITLATVPPCVVATLPEEKLSDLRTLVVAGEACPQALADLWAKRVRFVNAYGPTETTVWATFEQCDESSQITIGNAIPGCQVCVLDQHLQLLPQGCPGELCLSGEGLARGFIRSAAMTAQKFIPHPRPSTAGERLYRTGDIVIWRHDGRLEFLGRSDSQYKIRGYRIETGDIEAALLAHPQVEQATVMVMDGVVVDSKALVACVVTKNASRLTSADLREFASDRLPQYMVPSQCVILHEMPLTRSGKVDRNALLRLAGNTKVPDDSAAEKPEGVIERTLADMWAQLLKRDRVGRKQDFFQLGGQSLVAIQLISRIEKMFGVRLPLTAILDAPTVNALAKRVEAESCLLHAGVAAAAWTSGSAEEQF
jgi:amino acid adenylation domain-containing protein